MTETLSTVLELVGLAFVAAAGFLIAVPLGLFLSGVALVVLGYLIGGDVYVDSPKG